LGSILTPAERLDVVLVNVVELAGGAEGDRLGADLEDPDLRHEGLDQWLAVAAHRRIVNRRADTKDLPLRHPHRNRCGR
jgi:hypothetical protein